MTEQAFKKAHSDARHRAWEKKNTVGGLPPASATFIMAITDEKTGSCRVCKTQVTLTD